MGENGAHNNVQKEQTAKLEGGGEHRYWKWRVSW